MVAHGARCQREHSRTSLYSDFQFSSLSKSPSFSCPSSAEFCTCCFCPEVIRKPNNSSADDQREIVSSKEVNVGIEQLQEPIVDRG